VKLGGGRAREVWLRGARGWPVRERLPSVLNTLSAPQRPAVLTRTSISASSMAGQPDEVVRPFLCPARAVLLFLVRVVGLTFAACLQDCGSRYTRQVSKCSKEI
jgi:hypothetical protein